MISESRNKFVKISVYQFQICLVHAPEFNIVVFKKPPRKSAEFPVGAYIWSRADNCVKSKILREVEESLNVVVARKIVSSLVFFVNIPGYRRDYGVKSACFKFQKSVTPIIFGYSEIMNSAGGNQKRLVV